MESQHRYQRLSGNYTNDLLLSDFLELKLSCLTLLSQEVTSIRKISTTAAQWHRTDNKTVLDDF
jgi:hypothetical protein